MGVNQRLTDHAAIVAPHIGGLHIADDVSAEGRKRLTAVIEIFIGVAGVIEVKAVDRIPRDDILNNVDRMVGRSLGDRR